MYKKSPSRNQRSKGVKIKHILQICLLLGVCFWLIYQVKRSHDKRKEFNEKDGKVSVKAENDDEILKLGRKDLPRLGEESKSGKNEDEDEEDGGVEEEIKHEEERDEESNKHVEEEQEGENMHEDDDQEEDDNKTEEREEEGRGGGDDELDEQEKSAGEADHEGDFVDDEKEGEGNGGQGKESQEGNEGEEMESQEENENSRDEENHDGEARSVHEAREEHYRGDDASSAVSHDAQIISTEVEKLEKENLNDNSTTKILEQEKKANETEGSNGVNNSSGLEVEEKQSEGDVPLNVTTSMEKDLGTGSSNFENGSPPNATTTTELNDHSGNNATELISETTSDPLQNGTVLSVDSVQAQNATETGAATRGQSNYQVVELKDSNSTVSNSNQTDADPTIIHKIGYPDVAIGTENQDLSNREISHIENKESNTSQAGDNSEENNASGGKDGSSGTSNTINTMDESQHDPIDASDSTLPQEERDARVDLGTLPDIKSEVGNGEDAAAE